MKKIKLNNGVEIPEIGYGVWQVEENIEECIGVAIDAGYRHIDTAAAYGNEAGVGRALKNCGVPREDLFITTKLWNEDMRQNRVYEAFSESLEKLQLDYVDLYLLHWPVPFRYIHCYQQIEKLVDKGLVRAIGVSNCLQRQLDLLLYQANIVPAVNQIQVHPRWTQTDFIAYCKSKGIEVEAYSPLGHGDLIRHPVIEAVAQEVGKSTAQVMIRWHLQRNLIVLPKSSTPARIRENIQVFDFTLTETQMDRISALNDNTCYGGHPDTFDF